MERTVKEYIFDQEINAGEMIFLTGPRQVGKTTFARNWLAGQKADDLYFNWDDPAVAADYKRNPLYFTNIINERFEKNLCPLYLMKFISRRTGAIFSKVFTTPTKKK